MVQTWSKPESPSGTGPYEKGEPRPPGTFNVFEGLVCAHLHIADLQCAHLHIADLQCAYLHIVDLQCAHLHIADSQCANLHIADLQCAHLHIADLQCANLHVADLHTHNPIAATVNKSMENRLPASDHNTTQHNTE